MDAINRRIELYERTLEQLRADDCSSAAPNVRRLLMTLPLGHPQRRDLLTVLAYVERRARTEPA